MTPSLSSLIVGVLVTIPLASQAFAQVGLPVDPAELLRNRILVEESKGLDITCLGTESNDSIKVTYFQDRIVISLNETAETVFPVAGERVSVKICGFDGNDYLGVDQNVQSLSYQLHGVQILGGSGDDDLYAVADTLAALIGGLGSDVIRSNCAMSALVGDAIWQTTLGEEMAVDFSNDTIVGHGPQPTFVRIAVGFQTKLGMTWELFGEEDRTNENSNNPNDVLTLFGEVDSGEMEMLRISQTDDEDWKAHLPY